MIKNILLSFLLIAGAAILINGCANSPTDSNSNPSDTSITVTSPASNDTIGFRGTTVSYSVVSPVYATHVDLWIDGTQLSTFPSVSSSANPVVTITLDSSYIGKRISYQLIFYGSGVYIESEKKTNIYVSGEKVSPLVPYNVAVMRINSNVTNISWKDTTGVPVTFEIWRKVGNGTYSLYKTAGEGSFNINDEDAYFDKVYYYKVRAVNSYGTSAFSAEVNTEGAGGSSNVPAPNLYSLTMSGTTSVLVKWYDNSTNENYFKIERRSSSTSYASVGIVYANTTGFTDTTGITKGNTYYYRIKAYSNEDSSWSNELSIYLPSITLAAPTITSLANPSARTVVVNWRDNDSLYTDWIIERKTGSAGTYAQVAKVEGYLRTYSDTTIVPAKTYYYRIKAVTSEASSDYSNEEHITTIQVLPPVPTNVSIVYHPLSGMEIKWTVSSTSITKVIIERRKESESVFEKIAEVSDPYYTKTYWDTGTQCQTAYVYRLMDTDGYANSVYTPEITVSNTDDCK